MSYGNYAPFYRGGYFNPMQTPTMPQMAENQNQFAQPYQTPIQNNPVTMPQTPTNDMIFVLNENEASSFPVAPNNRVVLWDKNQTTFYVKSANAQGIPSMQIFDFLERAQNTPQSPAGHVCKCGDNFVTKEELKALQEKYDELTTKYNDLISNLTEKPKTTVKKSKDSDE